MARQNHFVLRRRSGDFEIEAVQTDNRGHALNMGVFFDVYIGVNDAVFNFEITDIDHGAVPAKNTTSFKNSNTVAVHTKTGLKFNDQRASIMIYLNDVIYKMALKFSRKPKKQFDFIFGLAWFFNRSVWRSAWYAMTDKSPNV